MAISPEQQRKKDEACRQSYEKSYNIDATGEKRPLTQYSEFSNQINNE